MGLYFLIIVFLDSRGVALTVIPEKYPTEQQCQDAGVASQRNFICVKAPQ